MTGQDKQAPQKIAMFLPALNDGGAERAFANLARVFAEEGHQVDILVMIKKGPFLNELPAGMAVYEIGFSFKAFFKLGAYLKANRPDILFSAMPAPNLVAIFVKLFRRPKTKVIITQHMHISAHRHIARAPQTHLRNFLMRNMYHLADHIVCVSKGLAADLMEQTNAKSQQVSVIYNPVFEERILEKAREAPQHKWLENKDVPVFLSVGRLSAPKDYEALIEAFADLREQHSAKLIILGEGPDREKLTHKIQAMGLGHDIDMPGFVDNPYSYMRAADALVHSTEYEGFGNVLVEALGLGLPVISSDAPSGPREILEDGKWGALVPCGDVAAMTYEMAARLEGEVTPSQDLKKRAECFTIQKSALEYLKLIQEIGR